MKAHVLLIISCFIAISMANLCPDKSECPGKMVCCMMADANYGCCPYPEGTCCADKIHCCPAKTTCNAETKSCDGEGLSIPFQWMVSTYEAEVVDVGLEEHEHLEHEPEQVAEEKSRVEDTGVICPDGFSCDEQTTCCLMSDGKYGCCPYPQGTCCTDREHCCPHKFTCHLSDNTCKLGPHGERPYPFFREEDPTEFYIYNFVEGKFEEKKTAVVQEEEGKEDRFCSICNIFGQCCHVEKKTYCCPKLLGCSHLKVCLTEKEFLENDFLNVLDTDTLSNEILQISQEKDLLPHGGEICPDHKEFCSQGETCCPTIPVGDKTYGCCDLPEATCCADLYSCCPNGFICSDEAPGGCERDPGYILFDQFIFSQRRRLKNNLV